MADDWIFRSQALMYPLSAQAERGMDQMAMDAGNKIFMAGRDMAELHLKNQMFQQEILRHSQVQALQRESLGLRAMALANRREEELFAREFAREKGYMSLAGREYWTDDRGNYLTAGLDAEGRWTAVPASKETRETIDKRRQQTGGYRGTKEYADRWFAAREADRERLIAADVSKAGARESLANYRERMAKIAEELAPERLEKLKSDRERGKAYSKVLEEQLNTLRMQLDVEQQKYFSLRMKAAREILGPTEDARNDLLYLPLSKKRKPTPEQQARIDSYWAAIDQITKEMTERK